MPRFIILEHTAAPDDPAGIHYDLLLEDGPACRTWRLAALPEPGGPLVAATELPPHRLAWLDHEAGAVSGGRGYARRIDAGTYEPLRSFVPCESSAAPVVAVTLCGRHSNAALILRSAEDGWRALLGPASLGRTAEKP